MRLGLAGLLAAGGLVIILYLGWIGLPPAPGSIAEGASWQLRELMFLKAAYERTQQDVARQDAEGHEVSASLYAEQDRIVRQMQEAARLLPSEAIPAELRALLHEAGEPEAQGHDTPRHAAGTAPASLSRLIETLESDRRVPDLRVGLRVANGDGFSPITHSAEFTIDPVLREPIRFEPAAREASRRKPRSDTGRDKR